jgi:hypothetical protein
MVRTLFSIVAVALISFTTFAFANAQTGPVTQPPVTNPINTPPAINPIGGMSDAEMLDMLKQIDPNVQVGKLSNGGTEYRLTMKADGWAYSVRLEVYGDNLWLDSELGGPIADMQRIPSTLLAELLRDNVKIGPTHFAFMKINSNYQLNACRQVMRPVTATGLRGHIDQFCKDIRTAYPEWSAVVNAAK